MIPHPFPIVSKSHKKTTNKSVNFDSEDYEGDVALNVLSKEKKLSKSKSNESADEGLPKKNIDVETLFDPVNPTFPGFDECRTWPASKPKKSPSILSTTWRH